MRVAREIRDGSPERVSPFAHKRLGRIQTDSGHAPEARLLFAVPGGKTARESSPRWRAFWRRKHISLDAVLQLPYENKHDLPFVITLEPTTEEAVRQAVEEMSKLDFLLEPPLALPIEPPL